MNARRSRTLSIVLILAALNGCGRAPSSRSQPNLQPPGTAEPAPEEYFDGKVVLGSPRLTAGIPGTGPLQLAEIEAWLAQPENHERLDFVLPLGLRDATNQITIPADNPLTRAKIELGRQLFFDHRLSLNEHGFSCGDCHPPRFDLTFPGHNRDLSVKRGRTVPPIFNRILSSRQLLDGRAGSLEEQALLPISEKSEMGNDLETCIKRLKSVPGYRLQFERIFGEVSAAALAKALASFERVLVTGTSPVDYVRICEQLEARDPTSLTAQQAEELAAAQAGRAAQPLSPAQQRGWKLFNNERTGCTQCHPAPNFTDEQYHNLGIEPERGANDLGRFEVTGRDADRGAFRTPTLRNVARTGPFMHRGQLAGLTEVIEWYDHPPANRSDVSPRLHPLGLTAAEKADLIEFLQALYGPLPPIETQRLPP